jgi:hypothetical protein
VIPASAVGEAGSSTQWGVLNDLLKDESHFWLHAFLRFISAQGEADLFVFHCNSLELQ